MSPIHRTKITTIGLRVFEKFGGKGFHFRPPSGGTANCRRGKLHQAVKLDSKFLHSNFFRSSLFGGRDIRGQRKSEFPGPEYENPIRAPPHAIASRFHYRQSRIINSSTLSVIRVVAWRVRSVAQVEWGRAKSAPRAMRSRRRLWSGVPYGKARSVGPSQRGAVFMLRPAGPKVEARRAEAKFWVQKIGAACNVLANKFV